MPRIERYSFGRVTVDGAEETRDVIVLPDRVIRDWRRRDGHALVVADLADVLDELPGHLVVGTGAYGRMRPEPDVLDELRRRGIDVEVLETADAVERIPASTPAGPPPRSTSPAEDQASPSQ